MIFIFLLIWCITSIHSYMVSHPCIPALSSVGDCLIQCSPGIPELQIGSWSQLMGPQPGPNSVCQFTYAQVGEIPVGSL